MASFEIKDGVAIIPDTVKEIGKEAFSRCKDLTSVVIPNSVTSIGEGAFRYCKGLTSVVIGNGVTRIEENAFNGCSGLTSVVIPNSVTSIGKDAFYNCSGLTSVVIPNSVTSIGKDAFSACRGLTSVEIPNSVTSIGEYAFCDCTGLTSVTIPEGVTSIGKEAFGGCSALTTVTLPKGVKKMPNAFRGCTGITTINIPANKTDYYKKRLPKVLHQFLPDNEEKKKKLVGIQINGIEKCLEARDENDDCISMFGRFSCDDLVFQVDGKEYNIEDFEESWEEFDGIDEVDAAEFFEGEDASTGILFTNKSGSSFNIELDEDEEFDPQKAQVVCRDFIYPNDTDESMFVAFVYDGVLYSDYCIESTKSYDEEQIWPISDDDDDWCDDEDDEDDD